jgi:hypothetical protein
MAVACTTRPSQLPGTKKMASQEWVHGLPRIDQVNQLCDGCLADRHRCTPFPEQTEYRAQQPLKLIHGDLCGPIMPPTPSNKKVFLLLIDDCSRYTKITPLPSKDCAPATIKLRCLCIYHGGEFISANFTNHYVETGVHRQLTTPYSS